MSGRFARLPLAETNDEPDVLVNVEMVTHVVAMYLPEVDGVCWRVYLAMPLPDSLTAECQQYIDVAGPLEAIHAALNGVSVEVLKAHPGVMGWVQNPALYEPPPWAPKPPGGKP